MRNNSSSQNLRLPSRQLALRCPHCLTELLYRDPCDATGGRDPVRDAERRGDGCRAPLEQLLRYAGRPGVCLDRLAWTEDGRVQVRFKRPWKNGTVGVTLKPAVFVLRLAALLLPGGVNLVRYHGVFGPGARARADIVPAAASTTVEPSRRHRRWIRWATLIERVFQRCPASCPTCGEPMALLGMFHGDGRAIDVLGWIEHHSPPIRAGPPG